MRDNPYKRLPPLEHKPDGYYHSDCHRHIRGNLIFVTGVLAASSQASYRSFPYNYENSLILLLLLFPKSLMTFRELCLGVPVTAAKIIRNKVLVNDYSIFKLREEDNFPVEEMNPFTCLNWERKIER